MSLSEHFDLYEPLEVIGNGSFGVIRKVRRKTDGAVFARKELNFERMSERDRKQIVAEVNILKELNHVHIVRYIDRHVDKDAGILYILMEYCGGGDLSSVIKSARKSGRSIPEETVWNYFMQILLALQCCHHPSSQGGRSSGSGVEAGDGRERRAQILHRDLKPDNVFLDESNAIKLGDFGLAKAMTQATLAFTYVGTPYYMSPELMQDKAYDSKADIWSLGCLIYELCALHPPFHEAKTHAQLSMCIQNARIPPLPRGYSTTLWNVIKAMLNINPAMRPSATQLLQHERIDLAYQLSKAQALFNQVKAHKTSVVERERDITAREAVIAQREESLTAELKRRDVEITELHAQLAEVRASVPRAIAAREEELRSAVLRREAEVATVMQRREEELMAAVQAREAEIEEAWCSREVQIREEAERDAEERWKSEWERLEVMRLDVEEGMRKMEALQSRSKKDKTPLEEVKNMLEPLKQLTANTHPTARRRASPLETPRPKNTAVTFPFASAMKGVVLTASGEVLATPTPSELARLFVASPNVSKNLGFSKIFESEEEQENIGFETPRATQRVKSQEKMSVTESEASAALPSKPPTSSSSSSSSSSSPASPSKPLSRKSSREKPGSSATHIRRPSKGRSSLEGPVIEKDQPIRSASAPASAPGPLYDLEDEANLPSPFLKKVERVIPSLGTVASRQKRPSTGNMLRVFAAANNAAGRNKNANGSAPASGGKAGSIAPRRASEEARKALLRT